MKKRLTLIRHAKSSWEYDVTDRDRPLNDRGLQDAHLVSSTHKNAFNPDLILSSDANRARSTASIFISNLNIDNEVFINPDLYDFSGEKLIKVIASCDDVYHNLMVFGHNHAITYFVNNYGSLYIDNVPTCGVVTMDFDIQQWKDLKKGKTIQTIFPKELRK